MSKSLSPQEREQLLLKLLTQLMNSQISEGDLLRCLRKQVLNMNQEQYAKLVGVSRRTLSDIERDQGNQSLPILHAVFKPLGLKPTIVPRNASLYARLINEEQSPEQ